VLVVWYRRSNPTAAFCRRRGGDAAGCRRLFGIERSDLHPGVTGVDLDIQSNSGVFVDLTRPSDVVDFDHDGPAHR
jgi:hypothetical protein